MYNSNNNNLKQQLANHPLQENSSVPGKVGDNRNTVNINMNIMNIGLQGYNSNIVPGPIAGNHNVTVDDVKRGQSRGHSR